MDGWIYPFVFSVLLSIPGFQEEILGKNFLLRIGKIWTFPNFIRDGIISFHCYLMVNAPPSPPSLSYLFIKLTVNPSKVYVITVWKHTS